MTKTVIVFFFAIIIGLGNNSEFNKKKNFIIFKDETANSGLEKYTPSFGAVFADIDMDGDDDLIVSNHGHYNPSIYLNDKDSFRDVSHLFRLEQTRDWHGITVVDLDNDGDKDIAIAGGGGGGVQAGAPNLLYQNLLKETGNLDFIEKAGNVGMIRQKWRGRHFLPVGNMDGSAVDLYFICKPRENLKNLYFRNTSFINRIEMKPDNSFGLDLQLPLDGRGDCFLDFDRDGDRDFFAIDKEHLTVFENINNHFFRNDTQFVDIDRVETFRFGDLNKDGYPDLYIGTKTKSSGSDNISAGIINDDRVLHFVVSKNGNDNRDRVDFKSESTEMRIYFITGLGLSEDDPSDIYIGRYNINPPSRVAKIYAEMAKGKPTFGPPGTYIWNNGFDQWSVVWLYSDAPKEERGAIAATTIYDIIPRKLEIFPKNEAYDRIFINQQGVGFLESNTIDLKHQNITRAVAIEDFNNDGWPDILGIRGSEPGTYNGDPFLIVNYGGLKFKHQKKITLKNKEDDIGQADQLVVGFINNDGLPDVFITNGHGLAPGNKGPYKLFINKTKTENNYTIIELEGSISTKDALGAKVSLYTKKNKFLGYQELGVGYNRMQSTHKLHFGLGKYNGVLKAKIHWPSGVEQFIRVKQNKINHIKEKE